jgi:hypothetical protein
MIEHPHTTTHLSSYMRQNENFGQKGKSFIFYTLN